VWAELAAGATVRGAEGRDLRQPMELLLARRGDSEYHRQQRY